MKYLILIAAIAALIGTVRATSRSADCCDGSSCCTGQACCFSAK